MGKSTTSCLKIIACSSDSVDQDEIQASVVKSSGDKRGWSFRKRSARNQVLSNSVITEAPTPGSKEMPEAVSINFQTPAKFNVPEKLTIRQHLDEKTQLQTSAESKISETVVATQNGSDASFIMDEPAAAFIIQTAIRGFLAQREIVRRKSIVKLQAAIRGHLVRRHAVETLFCIQAIVKVQALARARHSKLLDKETSVTKPVTAQSSIEKLLRNGLARQLLDSTPKPKSMTIKCDSSRPDSSWSWLERWMSVLSSEHTGLQKRELSSEQEQQKQIEKAAYQIDAEIPYELPSNSAYLKSGFEEALDDGKNSLTSDANTVAEAGKQQPPSENTHASHVEANSEEINIFANQNVQFDSGPQSDSGSLACKPTVESEHPRHSTKRLASEALDTEEMKFVHESRNACNPAFIAAQSKCEELSSVVNSDRSLVDTVVPGAEPAVKTKEPSMAEMLANHDFRIYVGGSECGTELSVTSTLDSPDDSYVEVADVEQDFKIMEERACDPKCIKSFDVEGNAILEISASGILSPMAVQPEEFHDINDSYAGPVPAADTPQVDEQPERNEPFGRTGEYVNSFINPGSIQMEQQSERNVTNVQIDLGAERERAYKSTPEASPEGHTSVPESQGNPSGQVSVKAKRIKNEKSGYNPKRISPSVGKKSRSNPNYDSVARSSVEQLSKDQKSEKRRSYLGSMKSDPVDQVPRDNTSSNSLPSYMQATESVRAKAHSPRSSPDVQNKDVYIKKRRSLPGASGMQESPRIQRSMSQVPQAPKGNGSHEDDKGEKSF
ncbi:hypothetical protein Nepgr_005083 [Nepenthes gracilis]|uniref:DUF4005 domain-containing protein n=1 Tax=Nepenthes gracilis TaxID=150966 RepID=A0AAD3S2I3_NEPGR|nr:hypothetical protein Nepgr_005083 [Nepenthes gracilis]